MAEREYIDVYKCREDFYSNVLSILSDDITNDRANEIIDVFDNLPHVDVQEVKHGHWIKTEDFTTVEQYAIYKYECSECGAHTTYGIDNYCYHCGAKMDNEEYVK